MTAQDRTLDHYHHLMQINAASHLIRAARELGVLDQLREGQRTLSQLAESISVSEQPLDLLLDGLVAIGVVEKYQDDFALSRTAHLLCQYDQDLGDERWERLVDRVKGETSRDDHDDQLQHNRTAATQWIHTPAAMQAAEVLDIGGDSVEGFRILDLGCGSAVWSCAMAHRDPHAVVTAVDQADALVAAQSTADSIGLGDRFQTLAADPKQASLPGDHFDLVLLAQRISSEHSHWADQLIDLAIAAAKPGARVAVIDAFRGPAKPTLAETIEALQLELGTKSGHVRSLEEIQSQLVDRGLKSVQFAFLEASKGNYGIAVGVK